jgi:hypothetical protein
MGLLTGILTVCAGFELGQTVTDEAETAVFDDRYIAQPRRENCVMRGR